ncbi:hypothetical protein NFI96_025538, partial [Prochilodus magdalenae]
MLLWVCISDANVRVRRSEIEPLVEEMRERWAVLFYEEEE